MDKDIQATTAAWRGYVEHAGGWQDIVKGVEPKATGCGPVYELGNPLHRPNEDVAIADMREGLVAEPHYHPAPDIEIYVVLQGQGTVVVGGEEKLVAPGDVVVMPPDTTHFTVPSRDLVFLVINTPPFRPDRYIPIAKSSRRYKYDQAQFEKLTK